MKPGANRLDLAGVFALVAPLAATIGLFKATGAIGRIQRDDPYLLWLAMGLVLVGGTMLTIATFLSGEGESRKGKRWERACFVGAALSTATGFVIALGLVFSNASSEPRPSISATLNSDQSRLTAHIKASNMETDQPLALSVDLATVRDGLTLDAVHPFAASSTLNLDRTYVGPDTDGNVNQSIELPIPTGGPYTHLLVKAFTGPANESCRELSDIESGSSCAILYLDPERGLSKSSLPR